MPVLTSHACDQTWVAGSTTSIIESLLVLARLVARATESAASTGNGRGASFVERRLRLTAAHRERSGCSPACLPPEGTSWPSSRCTDARTSPGSAAGALPRRAFAVDCTCSEGPWRWGVRAVVRVALRRRQIVAALPVVTLKMRQNSQDREARPCVGRNARAHYRLNACRPATHQWQDGARDQGSGGATGSSDCWRQPRAQGMDVVYGIGLGEDRSGGHAAQQQRGSAGLHRGRGARATCARPLPRSLS